MSGNRYKPDKGVNVCVPCNGQELIEYYKHHSLKEGFRSLDTVLLYPYKNPESGATHRTSRAGMNGEYGRDASRDQPCQQQQ